MPRLINLQKLNTDCFYAPEYFKDVHWDSYRNRLTYDRTQTYPYEAYVHGPTQAEVDPHFILDLRRFAERKAAGDVLYFKKDCNYKWCWNIDTAPEWDRSYSSITHSYWVLNFEDEGDMTMLKLLKPNLLTNTMSKFHPGYDYHDETNTRTW